MCVKQYGSSLTSLLLHIPPVCHASCLPDYSSGRVPIQVRECRLMTGCTPSAHISDGATSTINVEVCSGSRGSPTSAEGTINSSVSHFASRSPQQAMDGVRQQDASDDEWWNPRDMYTEMQEGSKSSSPSTVELPWMELPALLDQPETPKGKIEAPDLFKTPVCLRRPR